MKIKSLVCLIGLLSIFSYVLGKDSYYYYRGDKIPLQLSDDSVRVYTEKGFSVSAKGVLRDVLDSSKVTSVEYMIKGDNNLTRQMSNRFYVQLFDSIADVQKLYRIAEETKTIIKGQVPNMADWYELIVHNSSINNSLEMSNYFYETGLFKDIDPGFCFNFTPSCVSDSHFSLQWGMSAVNSCNAWSITKGDANVKIAIIDHGVETQHSEFNSTIFEDGYDCYMHNSSNIHNYGAHGTMVCGIISANHNQYEIAGIAPNCHIIPISHTLIADGDIAAELASGFSWAVAHGADIINCSWGDYNGANYAYLHSSLLESAIQNALTQGRQGKGCVVVFASGNVNASNVDYPASAFSDILAVGAINSSYRKADFSSYGSALDIVAPGENIYTTTTMNDYDTMEGTSFAAPHVSGIAGLILSVNPDLTQKQVAHILESTAQKVGNYSYTTTQDHLNGIWNDSVGYGLVDAYAAVYAAKYKYIVGPDYFCDTTCFSLLNVPEGTTCQWTVHLSDAMMGSMSIVSGQGTQNVCVRYLDPLPFYSNGDHEENENAGGRPNLDLHTYVTVTVVDNATSTPLYTVRKDLRPPTGATPIITTNDSTPVWYSRTSRTFLITNISSVPDSAVQWTVKRYEQIVPPTPQVVHTNYYYGAIITYNPPTIFPTHRDTLVIYATNLAKECEPKQSNIMRFILRSGKPVLNGTQNGDQLDVNIYEEREETQYVTAHLDENCSYTLELWNNIYGRMRTKAIVSATEQMDIHNIPKGVYVLTLKENETIIAQTKVLIQ